MERSTLMTTDRTSYYLLMCYLDRLSSLPYHLRLISSPGFLTVILLQRRLEILLRICQTSSHGGPPFAGRGNGYKGSSSISFLGTHLIQIVGEAGLSSVCLSGRSLSYCWNRFQLIVSHPLQTQLPIALVVVW